MCSWWWAEEPPETCRTSVEKINQETLHLVGCNLELYLRCTDIWMSNHGRVWISGKGKKFLIVWQPTHCAGFWDAICNNLTQCKLYIFRPMSYGYTTCFDMRKSSVFLFIWRCSPTRARASSFLMRFLDHTQRCTTFGRTPLDEWSARRRDLYLTTHNTSRQTSMPPVGFEPTISAGERPQTYALDRAATGIGTISPLQDYMYNLCSRPKIQH